MNPLLAEISHPNLYIINESNPLPSITKSKDREAYASPLALCSLGKIAPQVTPKERVEISLQLLQGLNYLHQNDLVHQDLKPDNFFLFHEGGKYRAEIGDCDDIIRANELRTSGTFAFLSPESEIRGPVTKESEIWSMGESFRQILSPILDKLSISARNSLSAIIEKMLDEDPSKRPPLSTIISTFQEILEKID